MIKLFRFSILQWFLPTQCLPRYSYMRSMSRNFEHLSFSITDLVHTVLTLLEAPMIPASKMALPVLSATVVVWISPVAHDKGIV